jgi:hypothetical protein
LQEISSVFFVSKKLRVAALKAWHLLLSQDNLHAPAIDDGDNLGTATGKNEMRDAARLMVDFLSKEKNEVLPDWRNSSVSSMSVYSREDSISSSFIDKPDDDLKSTATCVSLKKLEELESSQIHAEFMKTVGTDLLLDSFHLTKITGDRPLFTAGMMALKQHNLFQSLGIHRHAVAQFFVGVEDVFEPRGTLAALLTIQRSRQGHRIL